MWGVLGRYLRVTFACEDAGYDTDRIRAVTLAVFVALLFAALGTVRFAVGFAKHFGDSPVGFDLALRTLSLGWFDSKRSIPVTIVDIDDATYRAWGSPVMTPRDDLARMLGVVTAAHPAAVVVDIDLSWGDAGSRADAAYEDAGQRRLREFLESYAGAAPLVFPKRIEPAADGTPRQASSPFDALFTRNSRLAWAHASFETDTNGKVRHWREWVPFCTESGTDWLPSVPVSIAARAEPLPAGLERPTPPTILGTACTTADRSPAGRERRLLIGPRLTGEGRHRSMADAQVVPASTLLDPQMARDDTRLFGGRVVFIGATHTSSGDFWLTPGGVIPGVELLANAVRFSPLQVDDPGVATRSIHRLAAVALFVAFVVIQWRYRGLAVLFLAIAVLLAFLAIAVGRYDDFAAFDVVEAAILMVIVYKALETVLHFGTDLRVTWSQRQPQGLLAKLGAFHSACLRKRPRPPGDGHEQGH
jgi:CHASE2 domain-containing sensor protein